LPRNLGGLPRPLPFGLPRLRKRLHLPRAPFLLPPMDLSMIVIEKLDAAHAAQGRRSLRLRALGATLAVAALTSLSSTARADDAAARNLAEQLFTDGKKLMDEGRFDEACPKLAESQRLDPGGGTILNLAVCHEQQGRFAAAWSEFRQALALARTDGRHDRQQLALEHLEEVEPKVSHLTFALAPKADVPGLTIKLDGEAVGRAAWSGQLPVDPGAHEVVASATGKRERRLTVQVGAVADVKIARIPAVEDAPVTASAAQGPDLTTPPSASEPQYGKRTAGFLVGGLGLAAIGVGSVFGVEALHKRKDSNSVCNGGTCSAQSGVDLNDDARRFANYANVGIGVGIVALAVGTYLVLTSGAPSHERTATHRPKVSPLAFAGTSGFRFSGIW
jgi:hypothetical protein